jgi:DNA recombination protein RmuC
MTLDLISLGIGFACGLCIALAVWLHYRASVGDRFRALASEALQESHALLAQKLATVTESAKGDYNLKEQALRELMTPIREKLTALDATQHRLTQQLTTLDAETNQLVEALRRPQVRGAWGEMQLKRVAELAGMLNHCDFFEQQAQEGGLLPDMLVRLPGGKTIVVDAKAPLEGYLNAMNKSGEARTEALSQHARHVRSHIKSLAQKSYWNQFADTPEFVVLFLPGEHFFAAALEQDPLLIDLGAAENVILATPTTLIALLRAVHYGWRQEKLSETAQEIAKLGGELYDRIETFTGHYSKVGHAIENAAKAYNSSVATLETRLLVTARKLRDHAALDEESGIEAPERAETPIKEISG